MNLNIKRTVLLPLVFQREGTCASVREGGGSVKAQTCKIDIHTMDWRSRPISRHTEKYGRRSRGNGNVHISAKTTAEKKNALINYIAHRLSTLSQQHTQGLLVNKQTTTTTEKSHSKDTVGRKREKLDFKKNHNYCAMDACIFSVIHAISCIMYIIYMYIYKLFHIS